MLISTEISYDSVHTDEPLMSIYRIFMDVNNVGVYAVKLDPSQ